MKACAIAKSCLSERKREFLYLSFEYHRARMRHLGSKNVLAYERIMWSCVSEI